MPKVSELPWLDSSVIPAGATSIHDPRQSQIPASASEIVSDTGELKRNWNEETYTINTPRTQAAMGSIGSKTIALTEVEMEISTGNAVVAVQSLDGNAIRQSRSILISVGAGSMPAAGNSLPFLSEPIEGRILVSAPAGLSLRAWDARAGKFRQVAVSYKQGRYLLALDRTLRSSWLLLRSNSRNLSPTSRNWPMKIS
jgi:hypothetical protein